MRTSQPRYTGWILDKDDEPIGSCFQVSRRGLLRSIWHGRNDAYLVTSADVIESLGARENDSVGVKPAVREGHVRNFLAGWTVFTRARSQKIQKAKVVAKDPSTDLALLRARNFPRPKASLTATESVLLGTDFVVTVPPHPGSATRRSREVSTLWEATTTRDGILPFNSGFSPATLRLMRGAPVRRRSDDIVIGIVSARPAARNPRGRNMSITRTEDLRALAYKKTGKPLKFILDHEYISAASALALNILGSLVAYPLIQHFTKRTGRTPPWPGLVVVIGFAVATFFFLRHRSRLPHRVWGPLRWFRATFPNLYRQIPFPGLFAGVVLSLGILCIVRQQPSPVVFYLVDQTVAERPVNTDVNGILSTFVDDATTTVKAGMSIYGSSTSGTTGCVPARTVIGLSSYRTFKNDVSSTLGRSKPAGHSSLESAVLASLAMLRRTSGSKSLVVLTSGGDAQCDEARPRTSDKHLFQDGKGIHIRFVEVRLSPPVPGNTGSAFVQFLASGLDAGFVVGDTVADLGRAVAPPLYRNPGLR